MKKGVSPSATNPRRATVLGRSRFEKISAVEGIQLPKTVAKQFMAYDAHSMAGEERRAHIRSKYLKK